MMDVSFTVADAETQTEDSDEFPALADDPTPSLKDLVVISLKRFVTLSAGLLAVNFVLTELSYRYLRGRTSASSFSLFFP